MACKELNLSLLTTVLSNLSSLPVWLGVPLIAYNRGTKGIPHNCDSMLHGALGLDLARGHHGLEIPGQ